MDVNYQLYAFHISPHGIPVPMTSMHAHRSYELNLVTQGVICYQLEDGSLVRVHPGEILAIPTDTMHGLHNCEDADFYGLHLPRQFMHDVLAPRPFTVVAQWQHLLEAPAAWSATEAAVLAQMTDTTAPTVWRQVKMVSHPDLFRSLLLLFMEITAEQARYDRLTVPYLRNIASLIAMHFVRVVCATSYTMQSHAMAERILGAQRWIDCHYLDDISIAAIAHTVELSADHFTRLFRQVVGVTPSVYRQRLRFEYAATMLAESSISLDALAAQCGFDHTPNIIRAFHRYKGASPGAFRREIQSR